LSFFVSLTICLLLIVLQIGWKPKPKKTNDAQVVVDFVRSHIFCRFGVPRAIVRDQGTHFCNRSVRVLLQKYGVVHKFSTLYHP